MRGGGLFKWAGSLRRTISVILFTIHFSILTTGCKLFSLRNPETEEGSVVNTPHSFTELLNVFKESIMAGNINQYEMLLSDSFRFRVCDRIYYSNPEFYNHWNKQMEINTMRNLFLALSRNESYPVFFENYSIQAIDTAESDTQLARIEYRIHFAFTSDEVDTVCGYMDIKGVRNFENWQVDSIYDYSVDEDPCLSDVKVRFLSK